MGLDVNVILGFFLTSTAAIEAWSLRQIISHKLTIHDNENRIQKLEKEVLA